VIKCLRESVIVDTEHFVGRENQHTDEKPKTAEYSCSLIYWLRLEVFRVDLRAVVKLPSHRWGIPKFETTRLYICQTRGKVSNKHKAFHPTVH